MEDSATSDINKLRSDFKIFKTQVAIWAGCGVAVIFVIICILIYMFILIRKLRISFERKLKEYQQTTRFTIDRPKLLHPTLSYDSYDPPLPPRKNDNSISIIPLSRSKSLQVQPNDLHQSPKSPSPEENISVPSSFDFKSSKKPRPIDISPNYNGLYYNGPQLTPTSPQTPSKSSSPNVNKPDYYKRVNENFLNRNRAAYLPKEGDITPQTPISPTYSVNSAENKTPTKHGKFFS